MDFTFKKHIATGKYRSFERDNTDIKLKGYVVGLISETEEGSYKISFAIKKERSKKDPSLFRWVTLKANPKNEEEARKTIKKFSKAIQEKYNLYLFEKEV